VTRTPSPYLDAVRRARAAVGALDVESAAAIAEAIRAYAEEIEAGLSSLTGRERDAAKRSAEIIRRAAMQMEASIADATARGVALAFSETLSVWRAATEAVAASRIPDALLGAVRVPNVTVAASFEAVQPQAVWRTLLREHVVDAASEAAAVVREGLVAGLRPQEIAPKLRQYVQGAEELNVLFPDGKIDLRKVPKELKGAAKRMKYNSERIAFSEASNARAEAELRHFAADPLVETVRRETSPNRGKVEVPDICDVLATQDLYGLGPGVYPVDQVPPLPHPWCRCENVPIVRDVERAGEPKPNPSLRVAPSEVSIPGADRLTERGAARIREHLATLVGA
jgi:hypothetical protein